MGNVNLQKKRMTVRATASTMRMATAFAMNSKLQVVPMRKPRIMMKPQRMTMAVASIAT